MATFVRALVFIVRHPGNKQGKIRAVLRYLAWQLVSRIFKGDFCFNWLNDSRLLMRRHEAMVTHNYYTGILEHDDMLFFSKYLRKDDHVLDIGANAGVYTIFFTKVLGCKTVSIEPITLTFERLMDNVRLNKIDNDVSAWNVCLGDLDGQLKMTTGNDATNCVVNDNSTILQDTENTQTVTSYKLDTLLDQVGVKPNALKIDVEGYEKKVLLGAHKSLSSPDLNVLLIELNDSGLMFGHTDEDLVSFLHDYGFFPADYNPSLGKLIKIVGKNPSKLNTIFVKDFELASKRIAESNKNLEVHPTKATYR